MVTVIREHLLREWIAQCELGKAEGGLVQIVRFNEEMTADHLDRNQRSAIYTIVSTRQTLATLPPDISSL